MALIYDKLEWIYIFKQNPVFDKTLPSIEKISDKTPEAHTAKTIRQNRFSKI